MTTEPHKELEPQQVRALAQAIAHQLGETEAHPQRQIRRLIELLGIEAVQAKVAETLRIESQGGLLTLKEQRRRTPGGVFFYIIKESLPPELQIELFARYKPRQYGTLLEWAARGERLATLQAQPPGTVRQLTVRLQGRPGYVAVLVESAMVVLRLSYTLHKAPNVPYPRGVPEFPPQMLEYVVYAPLAQWEVAQKALHNARDELIVVGQLWYDPTLAVHLLLAEQLTTRDLERREQRAAKKATPAAQPTAATPKPARPPKTAVPPTSPTPELPLPDHLDAEGVAKLRQLQQATATLQERIATKTGQGQKTDLEQKLLTNTHKQMAALLKPD